MVSPVAPNQGGLLPAVASARGEQSRRASLKHVLGQFSKTSGLDVRNKGLGTGLGSDLTRTALGTAAYTPLDPFESSRRQRSELPSKVMRGHKLTRLATTNSSVDGNAGEASPKVFQPTADEPQRMFRELLLSDQAWATQPSCAEELKIVSNHRWTFRGAVELAERGQSYCFFVRCLLDMQQNVQCEEEGDALDPTLTKACKSFVIGQCNMGKLGDMYQLLTHFTSNAVIIDEWDRFLRNAFASERANQEAFLVPHLEQVWVRFCRMIATLEEIFGVLNTRFVWRHRLPKVGDIVRETIKRRCFSSKAVNTNEMFTQEKCSNETVKALKRCFALGQ